MKQLMWKLVVAAAMFVLAVMHMLRSSKGGRARSHAYTDALGGFILNMERTAGPEFTGMMYLGAAPAEVAAVEPAAAGGKRRVCRPSIVEVPRCDARASCQQQTLQCS